MSTTNNIKKGPLECMLNLFNATRNHNNFLPISLPKELLPYAKKLYEKYDQPASLISSSCVLHRNTKPQNSQTFVAFSGGKDSLAALLTYQKTHAPLALYHVKNITPYVQDNERKTAKTLATSLGYQIKEIELPLDNTTTLVESVIKNQIIYTLLMESEETIPKALIFGGTQEIGPQSMAFFHDSKEAFDLFHTFALKAWGTHNLLPFLKDEIESYKTIYQHAPQLVNKLASCMAPIENKEAIRHHIQRKFSTTLTNPYQCGACYKCAEERLISRLLDKTSLTKEYEQFCKKTIIEKCVFEVHNMNGLIPHKYLKKLEITKIP